MFRGSTNIVTGSIAVATLVVCAVMTEVFKVGEPALAVAVVGAVIACSPRQVDQWQRGVLLRLGRFQRVLEPGISWVVPGVDSIESLMDMRIRSTPFSAEKTLTRDTVPVNVDAVLFWVVTDAEQAVLEVEDYQSTVSWAAQTTLRGRDRKNRARGHDRRSRGPRPRAAIDHRSENLGVGDHGAIRGNPRRAYSGRS